ncbi:MAG TPA: hypothetical protein VMW71_06290 [Thermoplasmata archaeon]|nr:hypothetical protein [Thermoplasmata archaeon]
MDFVISKVGMSICALLVVSVLGQSLYESSTTSEMDALEGIVRLFDHFLFNCVRGGEDVDCLYRVPHLPDGALVCMTFHPGGVIASSENARVYAETCCPLNLWDWSGDELNQTVLGEMNRDCDPIESTSGDGLLIQVRCVPIQSVPCRMAFVSLADD